LGICSTLALLVFDSPASLAEDSNPYADPPSTDDAKKPPPSHNPSSDGRRRSDPKNPSEHGGSGDKRPGEPKSGAAMPARVNEAFSFGLNGCEYGATVRGTVRPTKTAAGEEPKYTPNLVLNAWVSCQNNTELRVTDNTLRDVAMTRAELERAIELHASLLAEDASGRCAYVPDFWLGESKLTGMGVSYMCGAGKAQVAGGPTDDVAEDDLRPLPGASERSDAPAKDRPVESRTPAARRAPERSPDTRAAPERRPDDRQ
jgi:hypothetical protein